MAVARAQSDRSFRVHEMVVQARATVHMGVACGVVGAMHGARVRGRFEFGRGRRRGTNHGPNIKAYEQCLRRVEYPSLDLAPPLATSRRTEDAAEKRRWPGPPTTGAALPGTGAGTPT